MFKILKFGGSSLASSEIIQQVADIILEQLKDTPVLVVVSAFHKITNELLACAQAASHADKNYIAQYKALREKHLRTLNELTDTEEPTIINQLNELETLLKGVYMLRECPPRSLDMIASFGELLSAQILALFLAKKHPAQFVDARQMVKTDDQFTKATVLFKETNEAIQNYFKTIPENTIPVVTGFIGSTQTNLTTTIGRNGSDYSAAIFGAALSADVIEIWTDVDGVYSADPNIVSNAHIIPHLTYEEAMELSHFGAKVLHPASITPAVKLQIPILIKNTFNPKAPGTLISNKASSAPKHIIKGISAINHITLLTLRGLNMVGVPGTAERLFRTLAKNNVNIILISQASSEHTICFAINENELEIAIRAINSEFRFEMENQLFKIEKKLKQTIIAVVGDDMIGFPGVAGKFCYALGESKININAIAQGASERNISLAIDTESATLAINAVHQFFFDTHKHLALAIIGVGLVGRALLELIKQQKAFLYEKGYDVRVIAIANSKKWIFNPHGLSLDSWIYDLENSSNHFAIKDFLNDISKTQLMHMALVDCTASSDIVSHYPAFIENNLHIVTPNKKANVLPWKEYEYIKQLLERHQRHFLFEANVGAGLPIISTLQDLNYGGDSIIKIEGIFSGTLSYLFNEYNGQIPFSKMIDDAHKKGFTEPDPRDDLSGKDVARKLLILARLMQRKMEFDDILVENLIPIPLQSGIFSNDFYQQCHEFDRDMQARFEQAKNNNCVLRYVGILDEKGARATLQEIPITHPLARTKNSDNIIAFTTQRYFYSPLVIQGPGAGAEVTAMGVFSDIYKLLHYLPY